MRLDHGGCGDHRGIVAIVTKSLHRSDPHGFEGLYQMFGYDGEHQDLDLERFPESPEELEGEES